MQRFDRKGLPEETLIRNHQEDFCQALSIAPELKYQQEGGPGLRRCSDLVSSVSSAPAVDVLRLFDAVVFNYLIGNGDAHGKNFSFLRDDGGARLAPLYDLVCTRAYPYVDQQMAMKIGTGRNPADLRQKDWNQFFKDARVGAEPAIKRMTTLAERIRHAAEARGERQPGDDVVLAVTPQQCGHLKSQPWKKQWFPWQWWPTWQKGRTR